MNQKDYKTIKTWLLRNGRYLEITRFAHLIENRPKKDVIDALKAYQNADGGFGHGLEADSFNPDSSPIQTWMALEIIDELKLPSHHPVVRKIIDYLVHKAPFSDGKWWSTIPSNNDYPHAPWWSFQEETKIWGYNPTAALAGFIFRHAANESEEFLFAKKIIQKATSDFLEKPTTEMHELRSFMDMQKYMVSKETTCEKFQEFTALLRRTIVDLVEKDSTKWFSTYCVRPLQFVNDPTDIAYPELKDLVDKELSLIMSSRNIEGVWDITWSWSNYPEAFVIAKRHWQSVMIVGYLKYLKAFGVF